MALLVRRTLLPQRLGIARVFSQKAVPDEEEEEFRTLELYPKSDSKEKRAPRRARQSMMPTRADRMPVDQHWPSVWPVAASFKPSVVPLPVRQGIPKKTDAPCRKEGNLELMKIPNFLHLTPPAIEAHCKVLKQFCSKWPEALTEERSKNWLSITTSDYIYAGPSIRDDRARIVTVRLKLDALELDKHARDKLITILGSRYNKKTDELVIVADRCPMRHQNFDYSLYALTAAYHESWITEEWELTERQEADMLDFEFPNSNSEKLVKEFANESKNVSEDEVTAYGGALKQLRDQGDNSYNLDNYKKAVLALMKLKAPESQKTVE